MKNEELTKKFRTFTINHIRNDINTGFIDGVLNHNYVTTLIHQFKKETRTDLFKHFSTSDIRYMYLSCVYSVLMERINAEYSISLMEIIESCKFPV